MQHTGAAACPAQTRFPALRLSKIVAKPASPRSPQTKRQGWILAAEGAQRAASRRLNICASVSAVSAKARGDQRAGNIGSTG